MAIYDNFPYTNIHEMNLRWVIEQVKQGNLTIEDFAEQLQQLSDDYAALLALSSAFTIAGSNISTTKNFSAASLAGPLTGNVTGNVTGNASTATHATTADSATTAGSATTATTATTANGLSGTASVNTTGTITASAFSGNLTGNVTGNLTGNVTGNLTGTATLTSNFSLRTDITSADADDYMPSVDGMAIFKTGELSTHIMSSLSGEYFVIIAIKEGSHGWQIAYCPYGSSDIFFRTNFASWTNWMKITATTAS